MAEYDRHEAPMAPGAHWPDGTPVSNWSQAVAALVRYGSITLGRLAEPATDPVPPRGVEYGGGVLALVSE